MASKKESMNPVTDAHDPLEAAKVPAPDTDAQRQARESAAAAQAAETEAKAEAAKAAAARAAEESKSIPPAPPKSAPEPEYKVANSQPTTVSWGKSMIRLQPGQKFGWSRFGGAHGIARLRDAGVKLEPSNATASTHDAELAKAVAEAAQKARQVTVELAQKAADAAKAASRSADKVAREAARVDDDFNEK